MRDRGTIEWRPQPVLDGRSGPFVVLEGPLADRVAGLSLIREDLRTVCETLGQIESEPQNWAINKALLCGALALYGKCFTQAKGRGVQLDHKQTFSHEYLRESHARLMHMRHQFVSHGGETREEQMKVLLMLEPDGQRQFRGIVGQGVSASGFDGQARKECIETVEAALESVEQALAKATRALEEKVQERGLDWAYAHAIWPKG